MQDHCKMQFKSTHYVVEVPCSYLTLTSGVLWRVFLPLSIVLHSNCAGEEGQDEACLTQTVQAGTWTPHFSNCTSWLVGKRCHWSKRGHLQALKSAQLPLHGTHTSYYSIFVPIPFVAFSCTGSINQSNRLSNKSDKKKCCDRYRIVQNHTISSEIALIAHAAQGQIVWEEVL